MEAKLKAQKKMQKPGGRSSGLAALKASGPPPPSPHGPLLTPLIPPTHPPIPSPGPLQASLSAHGFGGGEDLAVGGLPSLAGLLDEPKKHRAHKQWLRSKDFSAKRPASEKL